MLTKWPDFSTFLYFMIQFINAIGIFVGIVIALCLISCNWIIAFCITLNLISILPFVSPNIECGLGSEIGSSSFWIHVQVFSSSAKQLVVCIFWSKWWSVYLGNNSSFQKVVLSLQQQLCHDSCFMSINGVYAASIKLSVCCNNLCILLFVCYDA